MQNVLLAVAALFLVLLNGFFVAAEFGLVKLRSTRVIELAEVLGWRGRILQRVHGQLDTYLSACQLGITLASLGLGWVGEPAFARLLAPALHASGIAAPTVVSGVSFAIAFFLISFLHIVVGELAPKSLALRKPEAVGAWTAWALYGFYWFALPAIKLLNASANATLRIFGLDTGDHPDATYSSSELKLILRSRRTSANMTAPERNILAHSLDFSELEVSDLMRPIGEVVSMSRALSVEENLAIASKQRFTRYPYFDADGETVLGIIHVKDLFLAGIEHEEIDSLERFIRPAQRVAPNLPAPELFRRFRGGAPHFAVVGHADPLQPVKPVGFITLDNLLTAIVGEIRDEFGEHGDDWTQLSDGTLVGKGSLPLFTLERALGIDLGVEEVESIGGLVTYRLEELPVEGQRIAFDDFDVLIEKMTGPRITTVRIAPRLKDSREA
ncbi:hemolysin family protein [Robbsia sp. Bb-Pol-6]|uniref:Hemolysin family protein n=1 Tax=Robbsia betulipollinis TaxID=2981849 RepID=A0ABT3ZN85_9BURK|nr:hemolysin family protein [Robbsia betulipollinis]MCY0388001.1 hemolysin family protein [Robbsia betulipollinis]